MDGQNDDLLRSVPRESLLGNHYRSPANTINLKRMCCKVVAGNPTCCCEDQLQYLPAHVLEELVYYLSPASLLSLSTLLEKRGVETRHGWDEIVLQRFGKYVLQEKLRPEVYQEWAAFKVGSDVCHPKNVFVSKVLQQCYNTSEMRQHLHHVTSLHVTWQNLRRLVEAESSDNITQILHENLVNLHLNLDFSHLKLIEGLVAHVVNFVTNAVLTGRLRSLEFNPRCDDTFKMILDIIERFIAFDKTSKGVSALVDDGLSIGEVIMNMVKHIKSRRLDIYEISKCCSVLSVHHNTNCNKKKYMDHNCEEVSCDSNSEEDSDTDPDEVFNEAVVKVEHKKVVYDEMECVQDTIEQLQTGDLEVPLQPEWMSVSTDSDVLATTDGDVSVSTDSDVSASTDSDGSATTDSNERHRANVDKHGDGLRINGVSECEDCAAQGTLTASRKQDGTISVTKAEGTKTAANLESFGLNLEKVQCIDNEAFHRFKALLAHWHSLSRLQLIMDNGDLECLSNVIAVKIGCRQLTHLALVSDQLRQASLFSKLMVVFFENYRENSCINRPMEYLSMEAMFVTSQLNVCHYHCDILAVKQLRLRDCELEVKATNNLIHFLAHNKCLTHLTLCNVDTSTETHPRPIVDILYTLNKSARFLDTLVLEDLKLETADDFNTAMVELVRETGSLQQLVLKSEPYNRHYKPSKGLLQAIVNHSNLKYVALTETNLAQEGGEFLYQCMLKTNVSRIRSLDLRKSRIRGQDLIAVVERLKDTRTMKQPFHRLNISMNNISQDEQRMLWGMLRTRVEVLQIEIGDNQRNEYLAQM